MPALFLHGSADSPRCWTGVVDALGLDDAHVPALPEPPAVGAALASDLAWLDREVTGLGPPIDLVAHSYGALLALRYALAHPGNVRSLALCEPIAFHLLAGLPEAAHIDALNADFFGRLARGEDDAAQAGLVEYWNGPGSWSALSEGARSRLRARLRRTISEVASGRDDATTAGAEMAAPTLSGHFLNFAHANLARIAASEIEEHQAILVTPTVAVTPDETRNVRFQVAERPLPDAFEIRLQPAHDGKAIAFFDGDAAKEVAQLLHAAIAAPSHTVGISPTEVAEAVLKKSGRLRNPSSASELLSIPIAFIAKVVADHIEGMEAVAEFLGE